MHCGDTPIRSALIVDSSASDRERLVSELSRRNVVAHACGDRTTAERLVCSLRPDCVITETRLGSGPVLGLITWIGKELVGTPVIVVTGYASIATAVRCAQLGAVGYFAKPACAGKIIAAASGLVATECRAPEAPMTLQRAMWEYINQAVDDSGSIAKAARGLGLDRRSLRRMLAKHAPP